MKKSVKYVYILKILFFKNSPVLTQYLVYSLGYTVYRVNFDWYEFSQSIRKRKRLFRLTARERMTEKTKWRMKKKAGVQRIHCYTVVYTVLFSKLLAFSFSFFISVFQTANLKALNLLARARSGCQNWSWKKNLSGPGVGWEGNMLWLEKID